MPTNEEKDFAMFAHISAILSYFIGLPFLGPLVIYLWKRDSEYIRNHAKEALNFQISLIVYAIIAGILCIVFIGFVLLAFLAILSLVAVILNAIKAANGEQPNYPMNIRFIK